MNTLFKPNKITIQQGSGTMESIKNKLDSEFIGMIWVAQAILTSEELNDMYNSDESTKKKIKERVTNVKNLINTGNAGVIEFLNTYFNLFQTTDNRVLITDRSDKSYIERYTLSSSRKEKITNKVKITDLKDGVPICEIIS